MQDSWQERIEHGKSLISLGQQKTLSFSGDGGGQVAWKGSVSEPSGSGSSGVVSPSDGAVEEKAFSDNSGQGGSVLKEHDYIGLAEVSSASSVKTQPDADSPQELNLEDTDLRLGLGLGSGSLKKSANAEDAEKTLAFTLLQQEGVPVDAAAAAATTTIRYAFLEGAQDQRSLQNPWPNAPMRPITGENPNPTRASSVREFQAPQICLPVQDYGEGPTRAVNAFPGARVGGHPPALKNGVKRGYTEAMNDAARFNMATETRAAASMVVKNGEADAKVLPKHQQNAYLPNWAPSKPTVPTPWHVGLEQSAAHSFGPNKSAPAMTVPRGEKPAADRAAAAYKTHDLSETAQESATNEAPPPKGQVVGWPPIRSYRKNTLAKPTEMFVKVNMDGITVGRKVDLNAHSSYEGLLLALEEMFQPSNNAQGMSSGRENLLNDVKHFRLLNGSDFVLTYEDKDGDWMLVGDVPWSMFANTVRRLRITRGPEATGLAPRGSEKTK